MNPTLILDVDGVIFDSNKLKENNITEATKAYVRDSVAEDFVAYFVGLNGVPREKKIFDYFKDRKIAEKILETYNSLNKSNLNNVAFTEKAYKTLQDLSKKFTLIALSGGDSEELIELFEKCQITHFFKHIFGGPDSKSENLKKIDKDNIVCFVGDSEVDYQVATANNIRFIFMPTYSQFNTWKQFFDKEKNISIINNLSELKKLI